MSRREKLLLRLLSGNADANFDLVELIQILLRLGFEERNTSGSHRIFSKAGIKGIVNLQTGRDAKAKPYQVQQVRNFLVENKLVENE